MEIFLIAKKKLEPKKHKSPPEILQNRVPIIDKDVFFCGFTEFGEGLKTIKFKMPKISE